MSDHNSLRIAVRKSDAFERAIEKQWADFCKSEQNDLNLEITSLNIPDLHASLFEESGLVRGDFDVAFVVTDWIAEAVAGHHLVDLQSYLRDSPPENYPHGWDDSLLRFQTYGNEIYGLPYHTGHKCLIYRKDLIDDPGEQAAYEKRFGSRLGVPQTWDEFTQVARFFNRPQDALSGVVFVACEDGYNTTCDFCLYLWSRGGELADANGNFSLDHPLVEETLTFYRSTINDPEIMNVRTRTFDAVESAMAFAAGEAAMMLNWFSCAAQCECLPESRVRGKVGVTHFPKEDMQHGLSLNVYWVLGIARGSDNEELAYRFIRHCASEKMDRVLTLEGGNGSRLSTWQDEQLNQQIPFYRGLEALQNEARDMPRHREWTKLASIIDAMMGAAMNTDRSIASIVREGKTALAAEIETYKFAAR
jgi:multiple sugar transport system substrate-binding protein